MHSNIETKIKKRDDQYPIITVGIVEDTADAFQMGRMKVRCRSWNDGDVPTNDLPDVQMCSPFFGFNTDLPRGRDEDVSSGPVAYGQWTVPTIGSKVLITTIDNDQNRRVWLGSVPDMFYSHTAPHGRYFDDRMPRTSTESPIEPLSTNTGVAFNGDRESAEYATRAMDRQVSSYPSTLIGGRIVVSKEADQTEQVITNPDGSTITRTQGNVSGRSAIYSTTTPGFHSMSMDDDPNNCRMRFRTTAGHQVILDDTNERIYISTAAGKTWIEIDEKGTIDIYGEQDISISSDADVNITAKEKIRMAAGAGIHMTSGTDIRMTAATDMHIKTVNDLKMHSDNIKIETDTDMLVKVNGLHDENAGSIVVKSDSTYDLTVDTTYTMKSDHYEFDGTNLKVKGDIFATGNMNADMNITAGMTITAGADITAAGSIAAAMAIVAGTGITAGAGIVAGGGISATGGMSSAGSISASGLLTSTVDVVAGGTSLLSHTHMVPLPQHAAGTIPSSPGTPTAASIPVVPMPPDPAPAPAVAVPLAEPVPVATNASSAEELPAHFPSRVPRHEPYTRSYLKLDETDKDTSGETTFDLFEAIKNNIDSVSEYEATNPASGTGSSARGKDFARNAKWRR